MILILGRILYHTDMKDLELNAIHLSYTSPSRWLQPLGRLLARLLSAAVGLLCMSIALAQPSAPEQSLSFDEWVEGLRVEALGLGIRAETLEALDTLEAPLAKVLEYDNSQPEFVQTFTRYLNLA